jgi:hypothetical protein
MAEDNVAEKYIPQKFQDKTLADFLEGVAEVMGNRVSQQVTTLR